MWRPAKLGAGRGSARGGCRAAAAAAAPVSAAICLTACSTPQYVYKMYGGSQRPDAEISVIDLGDAVGVKVGDRKVAHSDYSRIQLLPGTYPVYWECLYGVSVMIEPSGFATGARAADVELRAGHVYSLHCDRTTGYGYQTFQWVWDDTEDRLVAGRKKP
jgi:hypothetical protein